MKEQITLVFMGYIISNLTPKRYTADCICGELLGIGFLIAIPFVLCKFYGMATIEPFGVVRLLLLGYFPGRVVDWIRRK